MRNSLQSFLLPLGQEHSMLRRRPEELSVDEFVELTNFIEKHGK